MYRWNSASPQGARLHCWIKTSLQTWDSLLVSVHQCDHQQHDPLRVEGISRLVCANDRQPFCNSTRFKYLLPFFLEVTSVACVDVSIWCNVHQYCTSQWPGLSSPAASTRIHATLLGSPVRWFWTACWSSGIVVSIFKSAACWAGFFGNILDGFMSLACTHFTSGTTSSEIIRSGLQSASIFVTVSGKARHVANFKIFS